MSFSAWPPSSASAGTSSSTSSPSTSATRTSSILRRSSRLIHTLQKERGSSCALCAACSSSSTSVVVPRLASLAPPSLGEEYEMHIKGNENEGEQEQRRQEPFVVPSSQLFQSVRQSRRDVDVALQSFLNSVGRGNCGGGSSTLPLAKGLANIRKAVDAAAGIGDGEDNAKNESAAPDNQEDESGIGAALRKMNLTPPIEVADETTEHQVVEATAESGIGAALRRAETHSTREMSRRRRRSSAGSTEFGGDVEDSPSRAGKGGFHNVLLMFNSLISTLIRVYVVENCHREIDRLGPKAEEQQGPGMGGRTSSFVSLPASKRGGSAGMKTPPFPPASPRGPARGRTFTGSPNWHHGYMRPSGIPPISPSGLPSSATSRHDFDAASIRDLRSRIMHQGGGIPSSDPTLFAFPPEQMAREGQAALTAAAAYPMKKKHTRWGSRGGFDLPAPSMVGSFDMAAASRLPTMPRPDSKISMESGNSGSGHGNNHPAFAPPSSQSILASKSISLLSLLLYFTKLKESTGIERAVLSSLMALAPPPTDNGTSGKEGEKVTKDAATLIPTMLFSDLVLEEENQRRIVRKLRFVALEGRMADAASAPDVGIAYDGGDVNFQSLLMLVEESVRLTPDMERIQDIIRMDFNLAAFHHEMSMGDFWGLITVYMDRLHATELLIIEELECCLANPKPIDQGDSPQIDSSVRCDQSSSLESTDIRSVLTQILGTEDGLNKGRGVSAITERLQSLPPEQIKDKLLAALSSTSTTTEEDGDSVRFGKTPRRSSTDLLTSADTYTPSDWDIDPYEIEFRKRVGRGVAGTTYLATWSGQPVAVKIAAITDLGIGGWKTECESLRQLHHPNIVRMLGSIFNPSPRTFGLVLEYCECGDLKSALSRWTPKNFFWKIAGDIANGMSYLHKKGIIHRDLKPANVLLHGDVPSGNYQAKLADFGVAALTQNRDEDEELTSETGTYRWMAPEVIRHESYSFMADVYSYGVVTWQLLTHEEPFAKQSQIEAAGLVALEHARPPFPYGTPETVSRLIEICWSENPYDRIPFEEIRKELLVLNKNMSGREKSWIETAFGHPVYEALPADAMTAEDAENPANNIDVVSAMEKKSGAKKMVRSKSWNEDSRGKGGGDKRNDDGKWRFSLLRKSKK